MCFSYVQYPSEKHYSIENDGTLWIIIYESYFTYSHVQYP